MNKKIFAISDIHGFYNETICALNDAGYDENNENHLLIVLGDIFDRGEQSLQIYEWLYKLTQENKAIVLRGNHDFFFMNFLEGDKNPFDYVRNGLRETIADFWHRTAPFESWCMLDEGCDVNQDNYTKWVDICRKDINEEFPELLSWLKSLPNYIETKKYIFTHGSIDTEANDWHYPTKSFHYFDGWEACHWDDGSFFGKSICNTDKTVVIGHFGTSHLRKMYDIHDDTPKHDILIRDDERIIALDATTIVSKKVNVLVIEDEII